MLASRTALIALVALFCLQAAHVNCDDDVDEKDVVVLTPSNFDEVLAKGNTLVEFYAPWCGHCQQLKPEYAKAATQLKQLFPEVTIAKIDVDEHKAIGEKHGIQGFPTLKWFETAAESADFEGGRNSDGIVAWVKKRMGPATTPLKDQKELDAFKKDKIVAVMFTKKAEGDAFAAFEGTAKTIEDVEFGVAPVLKGRKEGDIVMYKEAEPKESVFAGAITKEELKKWVAIHRLGYVTKFSSEAANAIFGSPVKYQVLLFGNEADKEVKTALDAFTKVCAEQVGTMVCVHVGADEHNIMEFFGVKKEVTPTMFAVTVPDNNGQMKKYKGPAKEEINAKGKLAGWVTDFMAGKVEMYRKSEPVPVQAVDGHGVTTLVGKTLDEAINDPTKDVLVEFYAPWCGHCKQLAPIYDKLGSEFASVDSVVIAKMDATANDAPADLQIQGFPTIMFWPAEAGAKPISFEGDRNLKGFRSFIKKEAKSKFEMPKKKKPAAAEL